MFARVSRYEVPLGMLAEDVAGVDETAKKVAAMPGALGLYYLVDHDTGMTMSMTLWESEQAMHDSEAAADELRAETSGAVSGRITSVERYEVVAHP